MRRLRSFCGEPGKQFIFVTTHWDLIDRARADRIEERLRSILNLLWGGDVQTSRFHKHAPDPWRIIQPLLISTSSARYQSGPDRAQSLSTLPKVNVEVGYSRETEDSSLKPPMVRDKGTTARSGPNLPSTESRTGMGVDKVHSRWRKAKPDPLEIGRRMVATTTTSTESQIEKGPGEPQTKYGFSNIQKPRTKIYQEAKMQTIETRDVFDQERLAAIVAETLPGIVHRVLQERMVPGSATSVRFPWKLWFCDAYILNSPQLVTLLRYTSQCTMRLSFEVTTVRIRRMKDR